MRSRGCPACPSGPGLTATRTLPGYEIIVAVVVQRTPVLTLLVGAAASICVAGVVAAHGLKKQHTVANLVGPLVARAHSLVTYRGSIVNVSSGKVVIQRRAAESTRWRTLTRLRLKSDGTFGFTTRVGPTGTNEVRNVYYRVVYPGDATHLPSSQDCSVEIV